MYVPRFWWHSSLNMGETFGVGRQETVEHIPEAVMADIRDNRPLEVPVAKLNALIQGGEREEARDLFKKVLKENPGEIPLTVVSAQLEASFENVNAAQAIFDRTIARLESVAKEGLIEPGDAVYGYMRLAVSIANAGLSPDQAIALARRYDEEWFNERITRDLIYACLRTNRLSTAKGLMKWALSLDDHDEDHRLAKAEDWVSWIKKVEEIEINDNREDLQRLASKITITQGKDTVRRVLIKEELEDEEDEPGGTYEDL